MIFPEYIHIDGEQARFYLDGYRCAYYVTESGRFFSCSHNHKIVRERKLTYTGHKFPTIRINIESNGFKINRNIPAYRALYETFVDRLADWKNIRLAYKDGNPLNLSLDNLEVQKCGAALLVENINKSCREHLDDYKKYFKQIVWVVKWRTKIPFADAEDATQDAYFKASMAWENRGSFYLLWSVFAKYNATHRYRVIRRKIEFFEDLNSTEQIHKSADYLQIESLDDGEKFWLSLLLQGYTRQDIIEKLGMEKKCQSRLPKLKNIYAKIREAYAPEDLI